MADAEKHKRTLRVKRAKPTGDLPPVSEGAFAQLIRDELNRQGVPDLLAWRDQVDHNLQVMGVIMSDLQSTATLAVANEGTAKDRLDELIFQLGQALENVGKFQGAAQQDEDTEGRVPPAWEFTEVRPEGDIPPPSTEGVELVLQAYRASGLWPVVGRDSDDDEADSLIAEAVDDADAVDPISSGRRARNTRVGRRPRT